MKNKILVVLIIAVLILTVCLLTGYGQQNEEHLESGDTMTVNQEKEKNEVENDKIKALDKKESIVYITTDISPEGLMAIYKALRWTPAGKVAVKLSTGEPPASNYLRPELIADLVRAVDGTIVECNTAYGGFRSETAMHYQVAKDHGFTDIADF